MLDLEIVLKEDTWYLLRNHLCFCYGLVQGPLLQLSLPELNSGVGTESFAVKCNAVTIVFQLSFKDYLTYSDKEGVESGEGRDFLKCRFLGTTQDLVRTLGNGAQKFSF